MNGKTAFFSNCAECSCRSSIFKNLRPDELEQINMGRFHVGFKAGEIMFKQGTPSSHFVCITSGLAKIYIEGYGKNLILALVKPVDYIFGPGVYIDNKHYYSVSAVEDSTACLVDTSIFKKADPDKR